MMTSDPAFMLMKPQTVAAIDSIWAYRKKTGNPLFFTLDAGANIHLLYPDDIAKEVHEFIKNELKQFCEKGNYIHDQVNF